MDSLDEDKRIKIVKYGKYGLLLIVVLIAFLIIISCGKKYSKIEDEMIDLAKKYIAENNINVSKEIYLELASLDEVEGTELCSNSSGVIVTNSAGKLKYQAYLDCPDYVSKIVDNDESYIELNNSSVVVLNKGETYQEYGYFNKKGVLVEEVNDIKSDVGIYTVSYNVYIDDELKETDIRKVLVISKDKTKNISGIIDTEKPTLILYGDTNITLKKGTKYVEPGFKAIDYTDGKISRKVVVEGTDKINSNVLGSYPITYSVTNSKGKTAIVGRTVTIVDAKADLDINLTKVDGLSKSTNISMNVSGEGYKYAILPNGIKTFYRTATYNVNSNNIYTFKIYDDYDNEFIKTIEISNIDANPPTGICNATIYPKYIDIEVNATDDKGIANYVYYQNKETSEVLTTNKYRFQGTYNKNNIPIIKTSVTDVAGNTSSITCTNKLELIPTTYKDVNGYDCLEPFVCYKQKDYSDPYQATNSGVGTIYRSGCLPTSLTIISTKFDKRSKDGNLYTPPTLIKEIIYYDGVIRGYSTYERAVEVGNSLGLKVSQTYNFKEENYEILKSNLREGNPALILITSGCYSTGAHYMALLGINEAGQVFLSDPYSRGTTSMTGKCAVNTWVDLSEMKNKGSVNYFAIFTAN